MSWYILCRSNGTEELILKEKGATLTNANALSSTDPSIVPLSENKHINPSTVRVSLTQKKTLVLVN